GFHLVNGAPIQEITGTQLLPVATGFGLNIPPGIRIPHTPGMTYSVVVASRDTAYGNSQATATLNILGPDSLVQVEEIKLSMPVVQVSAAGLLTPDQLELTDAPYDTLGVGLNPDANQMSVTSSLRSQETPDLAMSLNNGQGADYRLRLGGLEIAQGYAVAMGFDPATGSLSIEDNDPANNSYTLGVERLHQSGQSDSASVTADDAGSAGAVLDLGAGWDGSQPPPVQPNTTPTLPGNRRIYIPLVGAPAAPVHPLLFLPHILNR
ncbi:MAG: hypothetical protein HY328_17095, partial [Chloroflexi bacterium]|nr:hypothetical protein [Chloroflexota bacterium]